MLGGYRGAKGRSSSTEEKATKKAASSTKEEATRAGSTKGEAKKEDRAIVEVRQLYIQVHITVSRLPYAPGVDK